MLVAEERLPILNNLFRQLNRRASTVSPLSVKASLRNVRGDAQIKGSLDIEVVIKDNKIHFLEAGTEIYFEAYKLPSKLCNSYLLGQSWYHMRSGTSWADDFMLIAD